MNNKVLDEMLMTDSTVLFQHAEERLRDEQSGYDTRTSKG